MILHESLTWQPEISAMHHISETGVYGCARIVETILAVLDNFFAGNPVGGAVDFDGLDLLG